MKLNRDIINKKIKSFNILLAEKCKSHSTILNIRKQKSFDEITNNIPSEYYSRNLFELSISFFGEDEDEHAKLLISEILYLSLMLYCYRDEITLYFKEHDAYEATSWVDGSVYPSMRSWEGLLDRISNDIKHVDIPLKDMVLELCTFALELIKEYCDAAGTNIIQNLISLYKIDPKWKNTIEHSRDSWEDKFYGALKEMHEDEYMKRWAENYDIEKEPCISDEFIKYLIGCDSYAFERYFRYKGLSFFSGFGQFEECLEQEENDYINEPSIRSFLLGIFYPKFYIVHRSWKEMNKNKLKSNTKSADSNIVTLSALINKDKLKEDGKTEQEFLTRLHELIDNEKQPSNKGRVICKALRKGYLEEKPSNAIYCDEFNNGKKLSFNEFESIQKYFRHWEIVEGKEQIRVDSISIF